MFFCSLDMALLDSKSPATILDILLDVFLRCSNLTFVNYMRNLKDFHPTDVDTAEKIFSKAQSYYNTLIIKPNGWLHTTKNRAAFLVTLLEMNAIEEANFTQGESTTTEEANVERDRRGRIIDRTPPKNGVTQRTLADGTIECWCARCRNGGRWGNHDSSGHDEWHTVPTRNARKLVKLAKRRRRSPMLTKPLRMLLPRHLCVALVHQFLSTCH